ncbi:hypothetical protein P7C70_g5389, partial [Phenoliferia sp. Uapishka_3]
MAEHLLAGGALPSSSDIESDSQDSSSDSNDSDLQAQARASPTASPPRDRSQSPLQNMDFGGGEEQGVQTRRARANERAKDRAAGVEEHNGDLSSDEEGNEGLSGDDEEQEEDEERMKSLEDLEVMIEATLGEFFASIQRNRSSSLTKEDIIEIKSFVFMQESSLSTRDYQLMRHLFKEELELQTLYLLRDRIAFLANVQKLTFDACFNGCMAFTGKYADRKVTKRCLECKELRLDAKGNRRGVFVVIDPKAVIKAQLENLERARLLNYQADFEFEPDFITDVFSCDLYRDLKKTEIPDRDDGLKFFATPEHIALSFLTDGVGLWRKKGVWPFLALNLALPPTDRNKTSEVIVLGAASGHPKIMDTFLEPIVDLATDATINGFPMFSPISKKVVTGRYSFILASADSRAMEAIMRGRGANCIGGCPKCTIRGVRDVVGAPTSTTPYRVCTLPTDLDRREFPENTDTDPLKLDLRTHHSYLADAKAVDGAATGTQAQYEAVASAFGINGTPIISKLPGIDMVRSFPAEYLHIILLNILKNMTRLWIRKFPGLGEEAGQGDEEYEIDEKVWADIGRLIVLAHSKVPAEFGKPLPNPADEKYEWTGEDYSNFLLYYGPHVLKYRLPTKAYRLFMDLRKIVIILISQRIKRTELAQLELDLAQWVKDWEALFYQYKASRLPTVPSTIHGSLHLTKGIEQSCPMTVNASWVLERFCDVAVKLVGSKRHPGENLTMQLIHLEEIKIIKFRHNLQSILSLPLPNRKHDLPLHEFDLLSTLMPPRKMISFPDGRLRQLIVDQIARSENTLDTAAKNRIKKDLPTTVQSWGKLEFDAGPIIETRDGIDKRAGGRDRSFIRFVQLADKNWDDVDAPAEEVTEEVFAQVTHLFLFEFRKQTKTLAIVEPILHMRDEDGIASLLNNKQFQAPVAIEMAAIECGVSRHPRGLVGRGDGISEPIKGVIRPSFGNDGLLL